MNLILIGFMGSGKTTVAKALAEKLQWSLIEMDQLALQKSNHNTMHELFHHGGELLLREIEVTLAKEMADSKNQVISTGAGVVVNKIVLDYLRQRQGKVIFLQATFATIVTRLQGDASRPLFRNREEAESLFHFRQPLYERYADHIITVEKKSVKDLVEEIMLLNHG